MKDILQDVVAKTHSLGFLSLVKVTGDDTSTTVESMAEDRSVILSANTKEKVAEFGANIFGMPNLDKLALHLKNPEYQKNSKLTITEAERNGATIPTGIHFENEAGDFQNDFRFMSMEIINEKLKSVKFKGATWDVEFTPSLAAITRMKLQSAAHSEEVTFTIKSLEELNEISKFLSNEGETTIKIDMSNKEDNLSFELKNKRNLDRKALNLIRNKEILAQIT